MNYHNTKKKSYQVYVRKAIDSQKFVDLRPEKYYKDPKAKRNSRKKDKGLSCRLINPQMTLFTQGELCGDPYECGSFPGYIRCT